MALEQYQSEFTAEEFENAIRAVPKIGANGNWFIGDKDTGVFAGGVKITGTASVGQTIVVKAVDDTGRPISWEPAELLSDLEVIADITTTEEVGDLLINRDANGEAFELDEIEVMLYAQNVSNTSSWYTYIGQKSGLSQTTNLATNVTLVCRYKPGTSCVLEVYQYGYAFSHSRVAREPLDSSGKAVPEKIDAFRIRHFNGGVLPIGTHIVVTGRRKKV